jgi:type II secretory pathway pseudopilin PulG
MLLVLMLAVAVLTITMLGVAGNYRRSIVRDREVEMIHRGVQYARAVRRYYIKNGRYPTSIEQLENTNTLRYLRKRYKDPMSPDGQWKIVHLTDIKLPGVAGLAPATKNAGVSNQIQANAGDLSSAATDEAAQKADSPNAGAGTGSTAGQTAAATPPGPADAAGNAGNGAGPVLGGGAMLGVVSKSEAEGIHSFNDKSKYNEWYFIYDPSQERGQQMLGPYNPNSAFGGTSTNVTGTGTGTAGGDSMTGSPGVPTPPPPTNPAPVSPSSATP